MKISSSVSLILSTFAGGVTGYAESHITGAIPNTLQAWEAIAIGSMLAGLIAIAHLYQDNPKNTAVLTEARNLKEKMAMQPAGPMFLDLDKKP